MPSLLKHTNTKTKSKPTRKFQNCSHVCVCVCVCISLCTTAAFNTVHYLPSSWPGDNHWSDAVYIGGKQKTVDQTTTNGKIYTTTQLRKLFNEPMSADHVVQPQTLGNFNCNCSPNAESVQSCVNNVDPRLKVWAPWQGRPWAEFGKQLKTLL